MLSLKTLLNPAPTVPESSSSTMLRESSTLSSPALSVATSVSMTSLDHHVMPRLRNPKDANSLAKSKLRGPVKYPPFEDLDERSLLEIQRFEVTPFGDIQGCCSHIPYNSGKKDFFEKTGRESFEVFRYGFKIPGSDTEYSVMWDYNVGLVRMTPFFKCCGYGKTMPAKMLGLNEGLKEITHSITGGSIAAQGYWMPYQCARAVCATFCFHISGALIPIFGPRFPADCIPPESPDFQRMVISRQLVIEATHEAELARRMHTQQPPTALGFPNVTPVYSHSHSRRQRSVPRSHFDPEENALRCRPRLVCDPAWYSDTEADVYHSAPNSASSVGSGLQGYMITSRPHSSWNAANAPPLPPQQYDAFHLNNTNPWLSAVPRIPPMNSMPVPAWGVKRRFEYDEDFARETSASPTLGLSPAMMSESPVASPPMNTMPAPTTHDAAQKDAALLLLNLRMPEQHTYQQPGVGTSSVASTAVHSPESSTLEAHRNKRQRATSF